jgi:hypothetical protein
MPKKHFYMCFLSSNVKRIPFKIKFMVFLIKLMGSQVVEILIIAPFDRVYKTKY